MAKLVAAMSGRPLLFDAFNSKFCTAVKDRKRFAEDSLAEAVLWGVDLVACLLSDYIMLDTYKHIEYFVKTFHIKRERFMRVLVGVDLQIHESISPFPSIIDKSETNAVSFLFYGNISPLQGVDTIIRAVSHLKRNGRSIVLNLIGGGRGGESALKSRIRSLIKMHGLGSVINWQEYLPYKKLLEEIQKAEACLGIFGKSIKARLVIPNKVYDYAALNKVFITGNSEAMKEVFEEGTDYIGCSFGDSKALAEKMSYVVENLQMLQRKVNPRSKIISYATPSQIGKQWVADIRQRGFLLPIEK